MRQADEWLLDESVEFVMFPIRIAMGLFWAARGSACEMVAPLLPFSLQTWLLSVHNKHVQIFNSAFSLMQEGRVNHTSISLASNQDPASSWDGDPAGFSLLGYLPVHLASVWEGATIQRRPLCMGKGMYVCTAGWIWLLLSRKNRVVLKWMEEASFVHQVVKVRSGVLCCMDFPVVGFVMSQGLSWISLVANH